jgi:cytochrome b561
VQRYDDEARYTRMAIVLHWLIALLVIGQFAWGWWMLGIPKQPVGPRVDAFNLHKSIGMTILALMLVRLGWRLGHRPPPLPPMASWQAAAARTTHWVLYAALVVQPLCGYLGSEFSGYPVKYFGMTLPTWAGKNVALKDFLSGVHLATSWVIAGAVLLHVGGALKHAVIERDGLLARMGVGRWPAVRGRTEP